jgi:uncharacterized membrane protein YcaP (DUF421 family)
MEPLVRVAAMYFFLMVVFRLSGKRTLAETTPFDLLMMLVISETTQQAMVGDDHSMTHAFLLIISFVSIDVGLSLIKQRSKRVARLLEDVPLVIVEQGRFLKDRMDRSRVDEEDVLEAARELRGLERVEQIKYAVLERNGKITIIPRSPEAPVEPIA